MTFNRYSAIPNFGVPVDNPEAIRDHLSLIRLMGQYGITAEDVPTDLTDITPYYWPGNPLRFFVSRPKPEGPVELDIMPAEEGVQPLMAVSGMNVGIIGVKSIKIPDNVPAFAITGRSPRFSDDIVCVHEMIVHLP